MDEDEEDDVSAARADEVEEDELVEEEPVRLRPLSCAILYMRYVLFAIEEIVAMENTSFRGIERNLNEEQESNSFSF